MPPDSLILTRRTGAGPQELALDASPVSGFLPSIQSPPPLDR